jgi:UDP-N-acetylglucosamine--N-acetylmuramyl-(pentapeptide) pyrophosphoryl-undecaprenol N-acetylglucosamine transferase
LVAQGAGLLLDQAHLTPESLAKLLQKTERSKLLEWALEAKKLQKIEAAAKIVAACEELSQ